MSPPTAPRDGGSSAPHHPPAWSRLEKRAFALLVVGLLASLYWTVHPWYDPENDASMYVATARALVEGEGYSYLGMPFTMRPPGWPVLLTPLVATLGTSFLALNLYVSLIGIASALLLYVYARARLGWPLALCLSLALWLSPVYQQLCNQVMSDVPGLAAILGCLLVERWSRRAPSWRRELVLGLCVGLATYVRMMALLLVPAILVARLLAMLFGEREEESRRAVRLLSCLVAAALVAPWLWRNQAVALPPPADQTLNYSYVTAMLHEDMGDPDSARLDLEALGARVARRAEQVSAALATRLQDRRPGPARALGAGLLALAVLWVLVRRRSPSELFVLGSSCVLISYFGFHERLLLPTLVLVAVAAAQVLRSLLARTVGERPAVSLCCVAFLGVAVLDLDPRRGWDEIRAEHEAFRTLAAAIEERVAPETRLASGKGFHYGVYLERPVYSLRFAWRLGPGSEGIERLLDKYGIEEVVLRAGDRFDRPIEPALVGSYGAGEALPPDARLIRVRP